MPEMPNPKLHVSPAAPKITLRPNRCAYAELSIATNFSFLRGASHPDELVARAAELGYRAVAVTDFNSVAGAVRMHVAAKEAGLKLVIGTRLSFVDHPDLLVWPVDRAGYARLCRLLTLGKQRTTKGSCELCINDFLGCCQEMHAALVPWELVSGQTVLEMRVLKDVMGRRFSVAACCTSNADDHGRLGELASLARGCAAPLLAVNDVHYHVPARRPLQDVLTCIRHGCTIHEAGLRLFQNGERHLKAPDEMRALFADYPQAIRRGLDIAEECTFSLDHLRYEYPDELAPAGFTPLDYLGELTWAGARERYPDGIPGKVRSLLERELNLIGELKIQAYFLTVHDLVLFARARGILCQGRGSAANSAVCYCIGITSVDPARIDVLFERFVSAARGEPPDIDIDFEHERREEVIQHVYEKYGRERAGMTAEVITYRGRSAVRDVGKVMGLSLDTVDHMAKCLDWWDRGTLNSERVREIGLDPDDRTVRLVLCLTGQLLGFPRHLSQHVGGLVMTRHPLCEMVPIENASMPDRTVIEWDKQDIDDLGILKVDVLALGMLTCISKCLYLINAGRPSSEPPLFMHTIPAEDPIVYQMMSDADTIGVFQIESRAQMTMLPRLRPACFYDLVIEVAIVRPGPIQGDMVHPYLRRRDGLEPVEYPSQALRHVLGKTLGVPLFQEQAMRVAMVGAGFSAEEADRLRRAMAAWKRGGAIDEFRQKLIEGMTRNGYTPDYANRCFNQLRGFGEYGFPESHAASFALLVYVSAWIKRYHPAAFCCGLLNSQPMGFYQPAQIVRDAQIHSVSILPADINESEWDCTLCPPSIASGGDAVPKQDWGLTGPGVRLGFRMIRGLRRTHADRITAGRKQAGRFKSISHFCRVTELPAHVLKHLAQADVFQSLGISRRQALWKVLNRSDETFPLFNLAEEADCGEVTLPPMHIADEVTTDYGTAGLSLKRHPLALVRQKLRAKKIITARELSEAPHGQWVRVAGLVLIRQRPGTASGIVFVTLEDETGTSNLVLMPHIYDQYRLAARHAMLLQAEGYVEKQGQVVHVKAKRLADLSELALEHSVKSRDFH